MNEKGELRKQRRDEINGMSAYLKGLIGNDLQDRNRGALAFGCCRMMAPRTEGRSPFESRQSSRSSWLQQSKPLLGSILK